MCTHTCICDICVYFTYPHIHVSIDKYEMVKSVSPLVITTMTLWQLRHMRDRYIDILIDAYISNTRC